jgi:acetyl esterase/lipase
MRATTGSGATRVLGPIEHRCPEDHAVASDFLGRLRAEVSGDARAAAVLDGMLEELPPTLISSASKIPLRSVERLHARIRAAATELAAA